MDHNHTEPREQELEAALEEAYRKGVSTEAMKTLIFETGARWHPPLADAQRIAA